MLSSTSSHSTETESGDDARLSTFNNNWARQSSSLVSDGVHCQFQLDMNLGDNSFTLPSPPYDQRSHGDTRRTRPSPSRRKLGKTALNKNRHFVQHNYHDLLNEADSESSDNKSILWNDSFPMKLHRILDEVEKEGLAHIVSWQPHGRAFIIRDAALFSRIIMPKYFPASKKFSSIQRQLNVYGFEKITRDGPDQRAYYHEAFLRGRPELNSRKMVRRRIKGTGHKPCSNPDAEPDFATMPFATARARGSASDVTNGLNSLASVAPTLDGIQSPFTSKESDRYFCQVSLNQQQQVHPLLSPFQQMFQDYNAPLAQVQTDDRISITTQETDNDNEPTDFPHFHFDWNDAEIWKTEELPQCVTHSQNEQGV